eukprot:43197-Prymnesium_polylepis.1
MAAANRALLRWLVRAANLSASVQVHDLAASNVTQTYLVAPAVAGEERQFLRSSRADRVCRRVGCNETVHATTLDNFFDARGIEHVDQVSIDTEGHDALVLEGMRRSLSARRVGVVEFE